MGMEDVLRIDKILDFCDVPQLFVARDAFDTLYLCLLYDDETVYRYTGIRISTRRLESFLAGKADLRLLYLQPENEQRLGNLPRQRIFYRIDNQRSHPLYRCIRERRSVYVVCGL